MNTWICIQRSCCILIYSAPRTGKRIVLNRKSRKVCTVHAGKVWCWHVISTYEIIMCPHFLCCASLDVDMRETEREPHNCISVWLVVGPVYSSNCESSHRKPSKRTHRVAPALNLICCYMSEGVCRPRRLHLHNGGLQYCWRTKSHWLGWIFYEPVGMDRKQVELDIYTQT